MIDLLAAYRRTGADLPFGRREHVHGVSMEVHFWCFTHCDTGRAGIALIGVQQTGQGPWALCGLGGSDGFWRHSIVEGAHAPRLGLGARTGETFFSDDAASPSTSA